MEAAQFYYEYEMNGRIFDAQGRDGNVKFSHALYFNSKRPMEYGKVSTLILNRLLHITQYSFSSFTWNLKALGIATTKRERATMMSLVNCFCYIIISAIFESSLYR